MDDFDFIKQKLTAFIRRYYLNELVKGGILFFAGWLLYVILILAIEYFLWLSPTGRSILFWGFVIVSVGLFIKFILIPVAKLFKLSKGIDLLEASIIIGKHFPEVNDKLLNVLQLQKSTEQSDLLLAGITQKSKELKPIPFSSAVNFRSSLRYIQYAAFPVIIIAVVLITGNFSFFSESYGRVIDYKTAYEPPAPFYFVLGADSFEVEEGKNFLLNVTTTGKVKPENVAIHYNGEIYYLKSNGGNNFQYNFQDVKSDIQFYLNANGIQSRPYELKIIEVPKLLDFEIDLNYPQYLNKSAEKRKGTGNITIPEGTVVTWKLKTKATNEVTFTTGDSVSDFHKEDEIFLLSRSFKNSLQYKIKTSNNKLRDYESLEYGISVIKDKYPAIELRHKRDSIDRENLYFSGRATDDYGISGLKLVYYPENEEEEEIKVNIPATKDAFTEFFYALPGNLPLVKGKNYLFYFEVFDNDGINGPKRTKSEIISYRKKSEKEVKEEQLQQQGKSIQELSKSLEKMQLSEKELEEISRLQKQKENLSYNDRKKLDNFLERQKQQTEMMKNYSEKLKKSLEENVGEESTDPLKEELKERLERKEERLQENESLYEELQKYSEKIDREELTKKLENLSRKNTSEQKNMEQLLELTKRYYVQEKTQKLARDLNELAEEQEKLAESDSLNTKENQEKISKEFENFQKEMDDLEKENRGLKKPVEMEREKPAESEIQKEQEKAGENLQQNNKQDAKKNQKKAAEKMKEMSAKMKKAQMMAQGEQLDANIETLRQILDNLMVFSFEQEDLFLRFRDIKPNSPAYPKELRKQQLLKEHFQHIDDSLFALAVNNPMITEKITSKITDVEFDINKSLERLAENQIPQGTASQQYVMTGTNDLALMLGDVLENMQEMANPGMSQGGSGGGQQLSDIIISQEELKEQMEKGMNGEKGKEGENGDQKGESGKEEGSGKEGKDLGEGGEGEINEEMSEALFEIYKQQQMLRKQLEDKLKENGLDRKNADFLRQMEQVEREILDKGFNAQTIKRMNQITHRMLQLENAVLEQEEENKRTSRTNENDYENKAKDQILKAKEYFNTTEILNRQTLPLRQIYKAKVKQYFEADEN